MSIPEDIKLKKFLVIVDGVALHPMWASSKDKIGDWVDKSHHEDHVIQIFEVVLSSPEEVPFEEWVID